MKDKMFQKALEAQVLYNIGIGHANAARKSILVKNLHQNERLIRQTIENLRREGYAILVSGKPPYGYFFAENQTELQDYVKYMKSRLIEEYRTYKLVQKATKGKLGGQLPLF